MQTLLRRSTVADGWTGALLQTSPKQGKSLRWLDRCSTIKDTNAWILRHPRNLTLNTIKDNKGNYKTVMDGRTDRRMDRLNKGWNDRLIKQGVESSPEWLEWLGWLKVPKKTFVNVTDGLKTDWTTDGPCDKKKKGLFQLLETRLHRKKK